MRVTLPSLCLLVLSPLAGTAACRGRGETRMAAEEAILERRRQGLDALTAEARKGEGRLIRFDDILVVVRQELVQQVLDGSLPFERTLAGKFNVTIASCRVRFEDGFGLVELDGRARLVGHDEVAVELSVFGGIDVVELDASSSILRARVKVFAVEARRVDVLGMGAPAEDLVEDVSRQKLEAFAPLLSSIEIPVRLDRRITIPALGPEGGVSVPATEVPLDLQVLDVKSFRHRLWVTVKAGGVGQKPGARPAQGNGAS